MLVLTRRQGESIVLGDGIRVTIVSVGAGKVRIGVEAPASVRVDRQELREQGPLAAPADAPAAANSTETGPTDEELVFVLQALALSDAVTADTLANHLVAVYTALNEYTLAKYKAALKRDRFYLLVSSYTGAGV